MENEKVLSASEQKQRQQVHEAKKAEINTITEKLKTFVQPQPVVKLKLDNNEDNLW